MKSPLLLLLLLSASCLPARGEQETAGKKAVAVRITTPPKIDGKLDEAFWSSILPAGGFIQNQPNEGHRPSQPSEVRIAYDDHAIYVGAALFDSSPDSILTELGNRDDELNADRFRVQFDTYNTRQDGYVFSVYASGVQGDFKFSDPTFDAVWWSAVSIDEKGWYAEMRIPYSAIRFPNAKEQLWAMQATRDIRRYREFDQWAYTPNSESNPFKFWGTLEGVRDVIAPVRLSLTPYISGYAEHYPYNTAGNSNISYSYLAGSDLKYGLDERFTLDMTLFPDFGQVQSDNKVKNLGYREIIYDERRLFFKEGVELFERGNLFYSRRIGKVPSGYFSVDTRLKEGEQVIENPQQVKLLNATKLSGRTNHGLGIGIFNAVTDNMHALLRDSAGNERKILTEPLTNYNILVFDQQMKNNSSVYLINTNVLRHKNADDANVTGAGYTLFNKKNSWASDGAIALSQLYSKPDSLAGSYRDLMGLKGFFGVRKTNGHFTFGLGNSFQDNTFDARDMGYFQPGNFFGQNLYFEYRTWTAGKIFRNTYNAVRINHVVNLITRERIGFNINYNSWWLLNSFFACFVGGGLSPLSSFDYYEPRVTDRYFRTFSYYHLFAGISTDYRKKAAVDFTFNHANFLKYFTYPGLGGDFKFRYRFSDKFSTTYRIQYNYDPYNIGFADLNSDIIFGGRKLNTTTNTLSGKYIFKNYMSLTLNGRHYWSTGEYLDYYTLQKDGGLITNRSYGKNNDFSYNVFNIDLVYSWQFSAGSIFSVVYKNAIETESTDIVKNYGQNLEQTMNAPQRNSLSVKFLYFLDYQYFFHPKPRA